MVDEAVASDHATQIADLIIKEGQVVKNRWGNAGFDIANVLPDGQWIMLTTDEFRDFTDDHAQAKAIIAIMRDFILFASVTTVVLTVFAFGLGWAVCSLW